MRNLKRIHHVRVEVEAELPLAATTWDTANNAVIAALGPSEDSQVIELRRLDLDAGTDSRRWPLLASWDAPCPNPDLKCDVIVSLHHFAHISSTCLVLAGGDIVVVREAPQPGEDKIEIVGSVDAGITAAAWSPDEEILAVTTAADTLLFMTADFNGITSATFNPDDAKLSKQVSVGWGKAETQFKGKRAKALRDPTVPEHIDRGVLSACDGGRTSISWRGDGAFVAINAVQGKERRMIRVFSREGLLDSVSEAVDGMEGALSWKPSGQLIASIQRTDAGLQVIFFERNGLRHGEFPLRVSPVDMSSWARSVALSWNADSSALAVSYLDRIQIWTMGNYHYYLKQEIVFSRSATTALAASWHTEEALRLAVDLSQVPTTTQQSHAVSSEEDSFAAEVHVLRFVFDMNSGLCTPPHDLGATAVIDGRCLRLTPMRIANVPPPMALHELDLPNEAVDVGFDVKGHKIAVLHEHSVSLFQHKSITATPFLKTTFTLPTSRSQVAHQVCIRDEEDIYVLMSDLDTGMWLVHHAPSNLSFPVEASGYVRIFASVDFQTLCLARTGGVFELDVGVNSASDFQLSVELSQICASTSPTPFVQVQRSNDLDIAFCMTTSGTIFANERLLVKNCTSFLVTHSHLLFTTGNHLLKFVHLTDVLSLEVPPDEPEKDERCRSIERGAKLVTVMPTKFSVVLQMPRGNLETIYPRALVLAFIRSSINKKDYKAAFAACRAQRVDMNILYDHAPALFLSEVPLLINQLGRQDYIDLFLSQLGEENVSQTMYKETLPKLSSAEDKPVESVDTEDWPLSGPAKVNRICDSFLQVLKSRPESSIQNVITANLCKSPPDIEAGLGIIAAIPEGETDAVDTAMEHICFLADVNQIYDRALGMYDLRLALLAAQQSQKDPREYLPYLQGLQDMPDLRRKFTIENDLAHFSRALEHLQALGDLGEVRDYVQRHILYTQALELCRYDQPAQKAVLADYAAYLNSQSRYRDAAIAYESLEDYRAASTAYRAANAWRESLSSASLIPVSDTELVSLAQSLHDDLVESKDFAAAAAIARDYLDDVPSAARHLCRAYAFSEAFRLAGLHRQLSLIAGVIDPGIGEAVGTLTELMADCKSQLGAQIPRLRELRRIKSMDPLSFLEGAVNEDVPDNISVAPSAVSTTANTFMTRYTGATGSVATNATRKTSKNRRREERKRARGKKGSIYEEEYLVSSVGRLIERINSARADVNATVDACLRRGMRERGKALEEASREVVEECARVVDEVYEVQAVQPERVNGAETGAEERPQGPDGVLWDSLHDRTKRVVPVVQSWSGNALLSNA